ncbi:MAG: transcriptional regulator [Burkholderiales bacterium]|nr:transcriptional regulator [Burkholderiales bacterium]
MPFAPSKIRPPRPREGLLLVRPALEQALRDALAHTRAVLLCAAAGYGKTATLARALEGLPDQGDAAAWITLDEGDDLRRLLECLMAALEPFDPPWRTAPEGLIAAALGTAGEALPAMVVELVNTLEACAAARGVIVLDDVHHLRDEPGLRFVDLLLLHLGPRWRLALTARHEPALRLARLRAGGELQDFREEQLRFSEAESRVLLTGAGLDAAAAAALHRRCAGWPAGLRLALSGARGGGGGALADAGGGAGSAAMDRQAFDFLAAEVLDRIDPRLRDFLLATSVLQELEPARAAALSGDPRSDFWLAEIERLGLFATRLDEPAGTLRLHDLFRDALRHRARAERPEQWPRWLVRAAELETDPLRRQALLMQARRHGLAARALLADYVEIVVVQANLAQVLQLCASFPPDFAESDADLHRVRGMAHWGHWEVRQAEHHFARAAALYAARGEPLPAKLAAAQRSITLIALGRLGDAAVALEAIGPEVEGAEALELRTVMRLGRTWLALERCEFFAVAPAFEALVQALEAQLSLRLWFSTIPPPRQTPCRGIAPMLARWAEGALAIAGERPVPLRAMALLTLGWVATWQGRLTDAAEWLARAEAEAQWTGQQLIARHHGLAQRALLAAFAGRTEEALAAMHTRLAEHPKGYGDWGLWHSLFIAGRIAASCVEVAQAATLVQRLVTLQPTLSDCTPRRLHPLLGLQGTLAALQGRPAEALAAWQRALEDEEALDLYGQAAEVRVRAAALHAAAGAREQAAAALAPWLDRSADPGGALFARTELRRLAETDWGAALPGAAQARLRQWAALVAGAAPQQAAAPAAVPEPGHGLSARELDVLAQMAKGASNKVIARAFDLSPHTVKRHVANILDKLDLASRAQAGAWWHAHLAGAGAAPAVPATPVAPRPR